MEVRINKEILEKPPHVLMTREWLTGMEVRTLWWARKLSKCSVSTTELYLEACSHRGFVVKQYQYDKLYHWINMALLSLVKRGLASRYHLGEEPVLRRVLRYKLKTTDKIIWRGKEISVRPLTVRDLRLAVLVKLVNFITPRPSDWRISTKVFVDMGILSLYSHHIEPKYVITKSGLKLILSEIERRAETMVSISCRFAGRITKRTLVKKHLRLLRYLRYLESALRIKSPKISELINLGWNCLRRMDEMAFMKASSKFHLIQRKLEKSRRKNEGKITFVLEV